MNRLHALAALLLAACLAPAALAQSTFETTMRVDHTFAFGTADLRAFAPSYFAAADEHLFVTLQDNYGEEFTGHRYGRSGSADPIWRTSDYAPNGSFSSNPNANYASPNLWHVIPGNFDGDAGMEYLVRWVENQTPRVSLFDTPLVVSSQLHPEEASLLTPFGGVCNYFPRDAVSLGDLDGDGVEEWVTINGGGEAQGACVAPPRDQLTVIEWRESDGKDVETGFQFYGSAGFAGNRQLVRYVAAGDPDGDGRTEVVVVASGGNRSGGTLGTPGGLFVFEVDPVTLQLTPDGSSPSTDPFATTTTIGDAAGTAPGYAGGLSIADIDGDGTQEIVLGYKGSSGPGNVGGVRVYRLDGTANGANRYTGSDVITGLTGLHGFAVGDYDRDGRAEIYATRPSENGVRGWEHSGDAGDLTPQAFRSFAFGEEIGVGASLRWAAPAPNGRTLDTFAPSGAAQALHPNADDAHPELMAATLGALHLFEATPALVALDLDLPQLGRPVGAVGDANGDGVRDVVLMGEDNGSSTSAFLLNGSVDGQSALSYASSQPFSSRVLGDAVWFDANNDGHLDLAYTGGSSTGGGGAVNLIVMQNDGSGGFTELLRIERGVRLGDIEVLDYDFDGDQDLLMMGDPFEGGTPALTTIFRNKLDEGTVGFGRDVNHGLPALSYARAASVRLDGASDDSADDQLLLALQGRDADGGAYTGVWSRSPGDLAFADQQASVLALQNGDVASVDILGDEQPDLVISGSITIGTGGDPIPETFVYENTLSGGTRIFSTTTSTQVRGIPNHRHAPPCPRRLRPRRSDRPSLAHALPRRRDAGPLRRLPATPQRIGRPDRDDVRAIGPAPWPVRARRRHDPARPRRRPGRRWQRRSASVGPLVPQRLGQPDDRLPQRDAIRGCHRHQRQARPPTVCSPRPPASHPTQARTAT